MSAPNYIELSASIRQWGRELGFQQISELQHASGVEYLGPLPAGLQSYTIWSGGVHSAANDAAASRTFLNTLVSSDSATAIRKAGMDPM